MEQTKKIYPNEHSSSYMERVLVMEIDPKTGKEVYEYEWIFRNTAKHHPTNFFRNIS